GAASGGSTGAAGASSGGSTGAAGAPADGGAPTDGGGDTATASAIKGHPDPTATYPKYDGFSLYLVEEFNAPIDLDKDPLWTWGDGTIDDGLARFGEDAIKFGNGLMTITVTAAPTPAGLSVTKAGMLPGAAVPAKALSSGEFRSKYNMFRWGRYEVSMRAPTAESNFVLSMFSFRTPHFQSWREIDFELVQDLPASLSTNVIIGMNMTGFNANAQEVARAYPFGAQPAMALPAGYKSQGEFHTYAFEALPDHITWFVDGVPIRTKTKGVGANDLIVPELSMKVMMNHWVFDGTAFGGADPTKNTYPMVGEYDWFRFYKWDMDPTYPCEPIPACLPPADLALSVNNPKETTYP
ncbi:MAG TPA: glycoside hydrolase family 16 protein, partial [Polyangia bacterium]|nr:glycoside hydrolase family 16 protein [Polyangia bacterium]